MLNKKIMILTIIFVSLLAVSAVSAADNATDDIVSVEEITSNVNDTAIASEDTNDNIDKISLLAQEVAQETTDDGLSDDILAVEEKDDAVNIDENNAKTIISEEITNDKQVLTSLNDDKDILAEGSKNTIKITFYKQTGKYLFDKKIYFKITDAKTGKGIKADDVTFYICPPNGNQNNWLEFHFLNTNSNGKGVFKWKDNAESFIGTFKVLITGDIADYSAPADEGYYCYKIDPSSKRTLKVKVSKYKATIKVNKMTVSKNSKKKFKINVKGQNGKPIKKAEVKVIIYTGGNHKEYTLKTNSKGVASFNTKSLSKGKHKVKVCLDDDYSYYSGIYGKTVTSYITIKVPATKKAVTIKAKKMSAKYKKSALFKVTVKDKASGKRLKGIKVIMKVYTGKKYKKIVHKTNKKGKTGFNIKSLSKGKHKVVVIVKATSKFKKASKRTSIKITKPTKKAVSIKAKKLSAKYKSGKKFKAKVIESKSKKPVKGIKVTLKVGNKKAVTLKTNKNGIVKYSTKKLKVGNYKVVLKVKATSKFKQASKKTSIKIVKKSSSKKISTKLGLGGPRGLIYEWHYADTGLNDGVVIYPKLIDSNGRTLTKKVTVITSSGKKTGYTGRGIFLGNDFDADFVPMTRGGTARIIFHGDSKYAGSEYTVYF